MTWNPIGKPDSSSSMGIDIAGCPAMFAGMLQMSDRYMERGSDVLAPASKATVGLVGETRTSTFS